MCVGLNIYIDDNLMFTELSSRERVSVCENMHLSDNLHFTDSRRRTSMYLLGVNHLFETVLPKSANFYRWRFVLEREIRYELGFIFALTSYQQNYYFS